MVRIVWIFSFMFGVCFEWCVMFVEMFGVGLLCFSFCCIAQSELSSSF